MGAMLVLFTLVPLQRLEARLRAPEEARDLVIHLRDDSQAVGNALAALARLGLHFGRATVLPGVGSTAVLHVELRCALGPGKAAQLAKRLLMLPYVERVDTAVLVLFSSVGDVECPRSEGPSPLLGRSSKWHDEP